MSADNVFRNQKSIPFDVFDPDKYFNNYYSSAEWIQGDSVKFFQDCLHETFRSGDITGKRLLDIGTGPIPNMAFCAAPWFEEITLSDFSQRNLEFLHKWRDGKINHMDRIFEYLTQLDNSGPMKERQDELKRKIRNIVFCDVTEPNPTASTVVDGVLFDAITSSNCLEIASNTLDDIAKSVKNVSRLLKPGGHLILEGSLQMTFYRYGEFRFECYPITKNELQDIIQKEGFAILDLKTSNITPRPDESYYCDCVNEFHLVARKVEQ
ncbi:hypothetical protein CHS0354_021973 [Potamilus streckersoni]|uniref:Uncharacterized protein n=1 Tax=Potamilus streckersoni TaxID=2493646 RepID=A0AAE0VWP0_9BIVA|nr:hypothetical protein CHS0354_021973 [Potamilus streckersoni]